MSISRSASSCLTFDSAGFLEASAADSGEAGLLGSSAAIRRLRLQVQRIGPHFRTVLVSGEPGTGKEKVARALHGMSPGSGGPFVVCDAAGLEDALAKCDGSVGSTDALGCLMKRSLRGTFFLDGISKMPLEVQGRLVRALKWHELTQNRIDAAKRLDLRMIASTVENLRIQVSTGRFRQELYQRFATVQIAVPPLRERIDDVPELARCFLERFAPLFGKSARAIADEAVERMQQYGWPGNVRELEGVLRDGVLRCEGDVVESRHLPEFAETSDLVDSTTSANESVRLQDIVEQHVLRVLKDCGGNKLRAAEVLGISRSTLYRMLGAGASLSTVD